MRYGLRDSRCFEQRGDGGFEADVLFCGKALRQGVHVVLRSRLGACVLHFATVGRAGHPQSDGNTERVLESAEEGDVVGELGGPLGEAESVAFFPEVPPEIPPYSKLSPSGSVHLAPVDPCVSSPEKKERKGEELLVVVVVVVGSSQRSSGEDGPRGRYQVTRMYPSISVVVW